MIFTCIIIWVNPLSSMKPDIPNVLSHVKVFYVIVNYVTLQKMTNFWF